MALIEEIGKKEVDPPGTEQRIPSGTEQAVPSGTERVHHFSVDVEEFFHSTLLTERVPFHHWDAMPRRANRVIPWILEELAASGSEATFFVLGWSAERNPEMVREISEAGHEVAAHSWIHRRVDHIDPRDFRIAVRRSKAILEDITGKRVVGYRAPSFSIGPGCEWAFDVLLEEGFQYDSSIFPIDLGPGYGYRGAPRDPYWLDRPSGRLGEIPLLTLQALGRRFPAAGGGYLRLLPFQLIKSALRQAEKRNVPGTLYIHPWDVDPGLQPLGDLPALLRMRLHRGAERARDRLARLIRDYPSRAMIRTFQGSEAKHDTRTRLETSS